jgi:glycosyltransferase involved in cell wall biosynthesis
MKQPFFSIIIPTFNRQEMIQTAIDSILKQTFHSYEIIIIDNLSADKTRNVVENYKDKRIFFYEINNTGIVAKSRNLGIKVSKGKWIAFLDSDDWWTEDKLQLCFENINNNVDVIYHDLGIARKSFNFFKRNKIKTRKLKKPVLVDLLLSGNLIGLSSVVVRKDLLSKIGGIKESLQITAAEDYNTWLRIANCTDNFFYIKKKLGYILFHNNNYGRMDLSVTVRHAIKEFLPILNHEQKKKIEINLIYMSIKCNSMYSNRVNFDNKLLFFIKHSSIFLKFKATIYILMTFYFRIIK